jgi:hypothetical protein
MREGCAKALKRYGSAADEGGSESPRRAKKLPRMSGAAKFGRTRTY